MAAPTAMDKRPWKFVVIDDKAVLQELTKALPYAQALKTAPAAIAVCGDPTLMDKEHKPTEWWVEDCSAATENMLLAAHSLGLGAVWLGVYPAETPVASVGRTLKLPSNLKPLSIVAIGHPKGTAQPKDKYAKDNIRYNEEDSPVRKQERKKKAQKAEVSKLNRPTYRKRCDILLHLFLIFRPNYYASKNNLVNSRLC